MLLPIKNHTLYPPYLGCSFVIPRSYTVDQTIIRNHFCFVKWGVMIAAITCFFNPIDHDVLLKNYWEFRKNLGTVKLFTAELSFDGEQQIPDSLYIEGRKDQIFWQKERLLNFLVSTIPRKYDVIVWLDADILFEDANWTTLVENALQQHPLVQVFETAKVPDIRNEIREIPSITRSPDGDPGFGWAMQRDLFERTGLLDFFVTGGADLMMYYAATGNFKNPMLSRMNLNWRRDYLIWSAQLYKEIQGNIGCIPATIEHLYHGTYADREYAERWLMLIRHDFSPRQDLVINDVGIWEWSSGKTEMHEEIVDYYDERKEDEKWLKNSPLVS